MIEKQQIGTWTDTLASKAPVPGGGGASALGGALGAALGQMVANLTVGKKRYADVEEEMQQSLTVLAGLQAEFLHLADEDARVFAPLAQAYGMPGDTPEQKAEKEQVMEILSGAPGHDGEGLGGPRDSGTAGSKRKPYGCLRCRRGGPVCKGCRHRGSDECLY